MSSRTLNGAAGNSSNYSLIKFYNLSDLTDISGARVNLGLIGTLNVTSSPYLSISGPYNALNNQTITLNASTSSTPNTLVAYDMSGNINVGTITATSISVPSITTSAANISFNSKNITNVATIASNIYKPVANGPITFQNSSGVNTATLDSDGNLAAVAAVGGPLVIASTAVILNRQENT
jgi:hypothetical protein